MTPWSLPIHARHHRNRIDLTPNVCLVEATNAKRITARSVWTLHLYTSDGKIVGSTRNTRKWGAPVIEASVYRLPANTGYPIAELRVDPSEHALAVRFLLTLAKEFWP
jgi:hypothetical protein